MLCVKWEQVTIPKWPYFRYVNHDNFPHRFCSFSLRRLTHWNGPSCHPVASGQHQPCPWLQWLQGVDVFFVPMMRSESWYHWIGFVGKILTGNPWVFTIKLIGLSCKFSHHPILWRYHWNFLPFHGAALEKSTLLRRVVRRTASRDSCVMFCQPPP